jgi:hypothetical protein
MGGDKIKTPPGKKHGGIVVYFENLCKGGSNKEEQIEMRKGRQPPSRISKRSKAYCFDLAVNFFFKFHIFCAQISCLLFPPHTGSKGDDGFLFQFEKRRRQVVLFRQELVFRKPRVVPGGAHAL